MVLTKEILAAGLMLVNAASLELKGAVVRLARGQTPFEASYFGPLCVAEPGRLPVSALRTAGIWRAAAQRPQAHASDAQRGAVDLAASLPPGDEGHRLQPVFPGPGLCAGFPVGLSARAPPA